jgi:hypothetical protein
MFLVAFAVSGAIAVLAVALLARWIKNPWIKGPLILVTAPVLLVSPMADELIGKYTYDQLCKQAEQVQLLATIPVRGPFYTEQGEWRRSVSRPRLESTEVREIVNAYQDLITDNVVGPISIPAAMPVRKYEHRIISRRSGAVLAYFEQYATHGGWISQMFETPTFVRAQCFPPAYGEQLDQLILPFQGHEGNKQ